MSHDFWQLCAVFLTGHTDFKVSWIALWLNQFGAKVHGYSLAPPTTPNFYSETKQQEQVQRSDIADIRDLRKLTSAMQAANRSIVIHMAT
jgi:CDP-glucose 4,6-dehydratase